MKGRGLAEAGKALAFDLMDRVDHMPPVRFGTAVARVFQREACMSRAAEIAYYAILSTIPFGALLLTGLAYAAVDLLDSGWTLGEIKTMARDLALTWVPAATPGIEDIIDLLMSGRNALGFFGSVTLLITASLVFGAVSRALGAIFEVRARDRFSTTVLFTIALVAVAIVVILGLPALSTVSRYLEEASGSDSARMNPLWLQVFGDVVLGLSFVFLVVAVARVKLAPKLLLLGAVCFVAEFEIARFGFALYLATLSKMHVVYGSLAGVMAVIVWAYYVAFTLMLTMCALRVVRDSLHRGPLGDLLRRFRRDDEVVDPASADVEAI